MADSLQTFIFSYKYSFLADYLEKVYKIKKTKASFNHCQSFEKCDQDIIVQADLIIWQKGS